jgi:hypothetical protein
MTDVAETAFETWRCGRTWGLRSVAWLVCWLLEIPSDAELDQAALDAHIAALAESDREAVLVRGRAGAGALDSAA